MSIKNTTQSWGWPTRLIHWFMAILIIGLLILGSFMDDDIFDIYDQITLIQWHKSFGFVAFILAIIRIIWKLMNKKTPELPQNSKKWEGIVATSTHHLLYILMFVVPVTGWLMSTASPLQETYGIQNRVFNLFAMPDFFVPGNKGVSDFFYEAHEISTSLLMILLALHAGAALKHHFIGKNNILRRMIKG